MSTTQIERNFFISKKYYFIFGILGLIGGYCVFNYVNNAVGAFMIVISARFVVLFSEYGRHKDFLKWLDENPNALIFIYKPRDKQISSFIKERVIPTLGKNVLIASIQYMSESGDVPLPILHQINFVKKMKNQPLLIKIKGNTLEYIELKDDIEQLKNNHITKESFLLKFKNSY